MPLVSVVMPVRDRADTVGRALGSVVTQTFDDIEIIVVDDGSADQTAEVVRSVRDPRIRLMSQPPGGVCRARNRGIAAATGTWLTFLDSDDEAFPRWIECLSEKFGDGRCALVSCGATIRHPSGRESIRLPRAIGGSGPEALFLAGTFAVRRDALDAAGGYLDGLTYAENTELGLRILSVCSEHEWTTAATPSALVTVHEQASRSSVKDRTDAILRVLDEHAETFRGDPERKARWLTIAGVDAVRDGRTRLARRLFWRASRVDPRAWKRHLRVVATIVPGVPRLAWGRSALRDPKGSDPDDPLSP